MGFLSDHCTFTLLTEEISKKSKSFDCKHDDLNDFFANDFVNYSNELLGKTYCFLLDKDPSIIVCAFSIANDSIKTNIIPNSSKRRVNKNIPYEKTMRSYPAVLIGRLGVNENYKKMGIGSELMDFIKAWFIDGKNKTGCRFVAVDSYNEPVALAYYKNNKFSYLFNDIKDEKEYYRIPIEKDLTTRLMYFDLIVLRN